MHAHADFIYWLGASLAGYGGLECWNSLDKRMNETYSDYIYGENEYRSETQEQDKGE